MTIIGSNLRIEGSSNSKPTEVAVTCPDCNKTILISLNILQQKTIHKKEESPNEVHFSNFTNDANKTTEVIQTTSLTQASSKKEEKQIINKEENMPVYFSSAIKTSDYNRTENNQLSTGYGRMRYWMDKNMDQVSISDLSGSEYEDYCYFKNKYGPGNWD